MDWSWAPRSYLALVSTADLHPAVAKRVLRRVTRFVMNEGVESTSVQFTIVKCSPSEFSSLRNDQLVSPQNRSAHQYDYLVPGAVNKPKRAKTFPSKFWILTGSRPEMTVTQCFDASRRTSTQISCGSSKVTLPKPKSVGLKGSQLTATASQGRISANHDNAWTERHRMSQIEEKSFNPSVEDIVSAKVVTHSSEGVGLTMDVSKAHKRLRIREDGWALLLFQHRGKLYHCSVPMWSAFQRCNVEPHGSSTHTQLPLVPLHSARTLVVRR